MSTVTNIADHLKIKTKLVCSGCGAPGEGTCGCGVPYLTPGERAEAAVRANPEKSDRAIAEEQKVDHKTISAARKRTGEHSPVEKRVGKDGKARKMPKPRAEVAPQAVERERRVAELKDAGKTTAEIAKEIGLGERAVDQAAEHVAIAREAEAKVWAQLDIDPSTLSTSAQAKLEAAKRSWMQATADLQKRVNEIDEMVRVRVVSEGKEYVEQMEAMRAKAWEDQKHWRQMVNDHKPPFTTEQFKTILMCLHSDGQRTPEKLHEAFLLFNGKKLQLTGKRS